MPARVTWLPKMKTRRPQTCLYPNVLCRLFLYSGWYSICDALRDLKHPRQNRRRTCDNNCCMGMPSRLREGRSEYVP